MDKSKRYYIIKYMGEEWLVCGNTLLHPVHKGKDYRTFLLVFRIYRKETLNARQHCDGCMAQGKRTLCSLMPPCTSIRGNNYIWKRIHTAPGHPVVDGKDVYWDRKQVGE